MMPPEQQPDKLARFRPRRRAALLVSNVLLEKIFRGGFNAGSYTSDAPPDLKVVGAAYHDEHRIAFYVESESFAEVPECEELPFVTFTFTERRQV